jgi:anti-sigma regulatory factor (Ser/Thr protein kinase)
MTSELAINSARHVPSDQGDWLEVLVDDGDEVLRVSVRDPGMGVAPFEAVVGG